MRDVTGITGAAPTWLNVMNYLHDRFGSGEITRPSDLTIAAVSFPGGVEPPRRELFLAKTQPSESESGLDDANPQILAPAAGTIIALDPDIPPTAQRVVFEASQGARNSNWILDGHALAPIRGTFLWTPSPGAHNLSIVREPGRAIRTIEFVVRGSKPNTFEEDTRDSEAANR
jgi:penicillin-binding protein 1C